MADPQDSNGGPAFPTPNVCPTFAPAADKGMSLRDYFAGQALVGCIAAMGNRSWSSPDLAAQCYRTADALLAARALPYSSEKDSQP